VGLAGVDRPFQVPRTSWASSKSSVVRRFSWGRNRRTGAVDAPGQVDVALRDFLSAICDGDGGGGAVAFQILQPMQVGGIEGRGLPRETLGISTFTKG